ncbi:HisA/HisF-related TIM barrel protein [Arenibaculum pallidiluteum]|uniref:HisA/HisF-related TIM barrel protein n=1 Tax=Arenibaculum pallidiluteum TaxID=2812559 RepID=UPI001A96C351|nr:HisA/HisF-related TIM barrel protein [Arenibaculum pallidiluteum]
MDVIPVIDLRGGVAVHARRGQRDLYRPLESPLCRGNDAAAVVEGYLGLHPFGTVYLADLDAIEGRGGHAVGELARGFPDLRFWVDAGFADIEAAVAFLADGPPNLRAVLGTESLRADGALSFLSAHDGRLVLSLDHRDGAYVGPPGLPERPDLWPDDVIVMTLARVGSGLGPDMEALRTYRARAPRTRLFAAGGVRDGRDLAVLAALGIDGALVATALHEGRITAGDLAGLGQAP